MYAAVTMPSTQRAGIAARGMGCVCVWGCVAARGWGCGCTGAYLTAFSVLQVRRLGGGCTPRVY